MLCELLWRTGLRVTEMAAHMDNPDWDLRVALALTLGRRLGRGPVGLARPPVGVVVACPGDFLRPNGLAAQEMSGWDMTSGSANFPGQATRRVVRHRGT